MDTAALATAMTDPGVAGLLSQLFGALTTDAPTDVEGVVLPTIVEYAALLTGAISGTLTARARKLDIVGACTLAIVTGMGGGLMRDIILPTTSIYMLDHPLAIVTCLAMAVIVFFFSGIFKENTLLFVVVDVVSMGLFAFSGADKALQLNYNAIACVMMGVITAVGGGLLRDVLINRVPMIFRRGTYYAIAALAGTIIYVGLVELHVVKLAAAVASLVVTVTLRMVSVRFNLRTMAAVDLTPAVARPVQRAWTSIHNLHTPHDKHKDD